MNQKHQMVWRYAYHAGVDDLSFPWLCPLQERQHNPQSTGKPTACKVCHQIQRGIGFLLAATKPGQKTCENKTEAMKGLDKFHWDWNCHKILY